MIEEIVEATIKEMSFVMPEKTARYISDQVRNEIDNEIVYAMSTDEAIMKGLAYTDMYRQRCMDRYQKYEQRETIRS